MHHLEEKLIEYQSMPTKCLCFLCNFILTMTLSVLALQFGIGHLLRELNWMAAIGRAVCFISMVNIKNTLLGIWVHNKIC